MSALGVLSYANIGPNLSTDSWHPENYTIYTVKHLHIQDINITFLKFVVITDKYLK